MNVQMNDFNLVIISIINYY